MLTSAFVGLVFGQTSLVGLWGALSNRNWVVRLVGGSVGLIYLSGVFCVSFDVFMLAVVLMIVFTGLATAGLLTI